MSQEKNSFINKGAMEEERRTKNKIEQLIGNCSPPSSSRLTPCQAPSKRWLTYINPPHFLFYH